MPAGSVADPDRIIPRATIFGTLLYALFGIGAEPLLWGGVLIAAGLPLYVWQRRVQVQIRWEPD